jgi:MinD-like ATPase involved in chromosome partitioning or flagellar assembly
MYIVTFYSFKGGVGRSMALVNVAAELARRGKRVLVVDFDLEAPGLDTFDITKSDERNRGMLDFVSDFLKTAEVPDVREYVYQTQVNLGGGKLWVMPAGSQDGEYQNRFRSFNWSGLYANHNGFLLFEDLKAQWKDLLKIDYVLIDSRTGHTDVGGICTRQLPDAVVIFFYPNEQNRLGLSSIVSQIRKETTSPLDNKDRRIQLHFVLANVPDLDDEDEILRNEMSRFEESLEFAGPSAIIHHYDSLALLDQVTFTVSRRRSRLAKEYVELTLAILRKNIEDREGALAFLDEYRRRGRADTSIRDIDAEKQLQEIRDNHCHDTEVLKRLAAARVREGKPEEALSILTEAIGTGTEIPDLLLRRAQIYSLLKQTKQAIEDLKQVMMSADATGVELGTVIRMLRSMQTDWVNLVSQSPVLDRLEPDVDIIRELQYSPETLPLAVRLLWSWLADVKDEFQRDTLKNELSLCFIGMGSYEDARNIISEDKLDAGNPNIPAIFNYSMALWGLEGVVPTVLLRRIADLTNDYNESRDPNNLQCLSLVHGLIGNIEVADQFLNRARMMNLRRRASSFSCWSYLMVSVNDFTEDLDEMKVSFRGERVISKFLRRNSTKAPDPT